MASKLSEHPSVKRLIARYDHLPRRDQQGLKLMTAALILGLLYFAVWRPADQYQDQALDARERSVELLAWMQENRQTLRSLGNTDPASSQSATRPADGRELMSVVTTTARESGLSLQRFEPSGDSAIRVWLEDVPFNRVAAWLEELKTTHAILIDQASLDRRDSPGMVSVRLTLAI